MHAAFSLAVAFGMLQHLRAGIHAAAVALAGISMFVTSQYFLLVAPNKDYIKQGKVWAERGVSCLGVPTGRSRSLCLSPSSARRRPSTFQMCTPRSM